MSLFHLFPPSLHPEAVVGGGSISVSGGQGSQQVLGVCISYLSSWIHCEGTELLRGAAQPDGKHTSVYTEISEFSSRRCHRTFIGCIGLL